MSSTGEPEGSQPPPPPSPFGAAGAVPPPIAQTDPVAASDAAWVASAHEALADSATAGVPPMAGGYGAPAPDPANRPMGPKPIKGPKRNPMGCIGGIGLLSILIAVAIMAVLWSRAADDVTSSPVPTELAPPQSAIAPEAGGAATPAQGGSVGAAGAASCGTERTTIETAMQVFEVTTGTRPTSVEDLVTAGLVVPDGELSFQIDPAGVLTGTGACTGS